MTTLCTQAAWGEKATGRPVTTFTGFDFNSFCSIGSDELGANKKGIFLLNNGTSDVDTKIVRTLETAEIDFGTGAIKHLRFLYLEISVEQTVQIYVTVTSRQDAYSKMIMCNPGILTYRIPISHRVRGSHLKVMLSSTGVFALDGIDAQVIVTHYGKHEIAGI